MRSIDNFPDFSWTHLFRSLRLLSCFFVLQQISSAIPVMKQCRSEHNCQIVLLHSVLRRVRSDSIQMTEQHFQRFTVLVGQSGEQLFELFETSRDIWHFWKIQIFSWFSRFLDFFKIEFSFFLLKKIGWKAAKNHREKLKFGWFLAIFRVF